jgi:hypothetical protein
MQLIEWLKLIISPALSNIEGWRVLSSYRESGINKIDQLNTILIFILIRQSLCHLHKNREIFLSSKPVSLRVNLQFPLYSINNLPFGIYNTISSRESLKSKVPSHKLRNKLYQLYAFISSLRHYNGRLLIR